jgi:hypothetical protein
MPDCRRRPVPSPPAGPRVGMLRPIDAFYLASPLMARYLSRSGETTRIRVTCSSRREVDAWAMNGAQGKAPAACAAEAFAPGE